MSHVGKRTKAAEKLFEGKAPAVHLFGGPYYFAEQLGFRKVIDTTPGRMRIAALFPQHPAQRFGDARAVSRLGLRTPSRLADSAMLKLVCSSASSVPISTVRGRVGFTFTPTFLIYGTGGLAYGQTSSRTSITEIVESDPALPNHDSSFGSFSNSRLLVNRNVAFRSGRRS